MKKDTLFVFDIETVPDTTAAKALTDCKSDDVQDLRKALADYHLGVTNGNNDFPRQPFHQIVAISVVECDILQTPEKGQLGGEQYHLRRIFSNTHDDEQEMLSGFFAYCAKKQPRFVTFNGRNFDLPVLQFRAMKHGIGAPWLHRSGDKWENYFSRYSELWHCDLLDVLKNHGAMSGGLKLNEIASILNLPGKIGVDGSMVSQMYDDGQLDDIRNYCETDVLNTYLVYLHHQRHTGVLTEEHFKKEIDNIQQHLVEEGQGRPHLKEFSDAWQDAEKGVEQAA